MSESSMPQLNPEFFASQIFWLIISFAILYIVMAKFALPKIADVIESRKDIIARDFEDAESYKKDSVATEQKYLDSIKVAHEKASASIAKSKKKLHQSLDDANENFEKENGMVISKFETQLNAKKADILEDKEVLAYEISHDIIRKILGKDALIDDNVKDNIKRVIKN
jgi:F-type H+-transporting ATPase subunit b